jgi:hypothetical protein
MQVPLEIVRRAVLLVDGLAELDHPAGFVDVVLPGLAALVGCDMLTYNEIGPATDQVQYCEYPAGVLAVVDQAMFAAHVHQQLHRTGLYAEFFRRVPVEHQLAIRLPGVDAQVIGVALSRARTDFTEADRELLGLLRLPLMTALLRAHGRHDAQRAR